MKNVSAAVKIHYRQIAFLIFVKNCGWQDDAVQNDNPDDIPYLCGFIRYVAGVLPSGDPLNWQRK